MKTNAARILDGLGIPYELRDYDPGGEHLTAAQVAERVGLPPEQVFKTLVARGRRALTETAMSVSESALVASLLDLICDAAAEAVATDEATLDERALATALDVSLATIDRMCQAGQIPFVRRFRLDEVRAALRVREGDQRASSLLAMTPAPGIEPCGEG